MNAAPAELSKTDILLDLQICESLMVSAMEIQLTPEQENLLAQLASDKGKAVDSSQRK